MATFQGTNVHEGEKTCLLCGYKDCEPTDYIPEISLDDPGDQAKPKDYIPEISLDDPIMKAENLKYNKVSKIDTFLDVEKATQA